MSPDAFEQEICEAMPEVAWQTHLLALGAGTGWATMHIRAARTKDGRWITPVAGDGKGWPDTTFAKAGRRLIVAEAKTEHGTFSPEQIEWLDLLESVPGIVVCAWRPTMRHSIHAYLENPLAPCPGLWADEREFAKVRRS